MTKSEVVNLTIQKFGYPDTLIAEYRHWLILLRARQVTLGALILAHKGEAESLGQVEPVAFAEIARVTRDIELGLKSTFGYEKLNYLLLMMVDPHVHFHVLPRYGTAKTFEGLEIPDVGWPGPPDLSSGAAVGGPMLFTLKDHLRRHWPA